MWAGDPNPGRAGLAAAAVVVVAMVATGCSGSKPSSKTVPTTAPAATVLPTTTTVAAPPAAIANACGMLTAQQIEAALGGTPGAGSENDGQGETICEWTVTKTNGSGFGLELHLYSGRSAADWVQQRQIASSPTSSVSGLGDDAFNEVVRTGGIYDDLWVKRGSVNFRIEVLADLGVAPLRLLAEDVLTHLG